MIGQVFGSLTVMRKSRLKANRYYVKCDCGTQGALTPTVARTRLLSGRTTHCLSPVHAKRGY